MSTWLVDTHALLWFLKDDPQLSVPAKTTMESGQSVLLVSTASIWEIAIKRSLGKLETPDDLPSVLESEGFRTLSIQPRHAWAVRELPVGDHRDPFDRLLAAQAVVEDLPVISNDSDLELYGVQRHW